jgi:FtsP/CotA-like multicopper oxidase with cupredoxin domain
MQTTRRAFLTAVVAGAGSLVCERIEAAIDHTDVTPDVPLRIAKCELEVAPGHTVQTTAYNGSVPGPLIRLREHVPMTVEISNDTDIPEYVHWHGLPVAAAIDGTEEEKSLIVAPHGRLRYRMTPEVSGSRWVHSHVMAMRDLTTGGYGGQFGFVYIEPKSDPGSYDQELFLATHEWEPFFIEGEEGDMVGAPEKFGETDWGPTMVEVGYGIRSINGRALGHSDPVRVKRGQRVLFHLLNASATENIRLSLPGHEFLVVALDGNPVPRPRSVGVLELAVAERVDAIVEMNNPGVWILGSTDDDARGAGLGVLVEYAGKKGIAVQGKRTSEEWDYTKFGGTERPPRAEEVIPMVIDRMAPDARGLERWTINGTSYNPRDNPKALRKGSRYRLVFDNRTSDAHPLHLHRHTFELTRVNGKPTSGVRKDVVLVKAYQTVEVDFTPRQEGLTLFHCHQQLHMDTGFKMLFDIT